jgi:hypothetical protein
VSRLSRPARRILALIAAVTAGLLACSPVALAQPAARTVSSAHSYFRDRVVLNGMKLWHYYLPAGSSVRAREHLSSPDDITVLGHHLFTAFQNGVGAQGTPATDGNDDSTVVEFTASGHVVRQWDLRGKCDGLTADVARGIVIATIDEDANSSIVTIRPGAPRGQQVVRYQYNLSPLPHNGGTDAISIYHGLILVSASAPGTTGSPAPQPAYPAVYSLTFSRATRTATVQPVFYDEASATVANLGPSHGQAVALALTDPDSNEIVPASGPRFAGDFMVTSQGDKEQIFVQARGPFGSRLAVLRLSQSVDDTAWARSRHGRLFGTSTAGDTVDVVTGPFDRGTVLVAVTPCDAGNAPATCPAAGFPPNYLGQLNSWTGHISRVRITGPRFGPQGLVFIAPGWNVMPG